MRVNNFSLIAQKVSSSQSRKSHNWVNDEKKLEMGDLPELVQSKATYSKRGYWVSYWALEPVCPYIG